MSNQENSKRYKLSLAFTIIFFSSSDRIGFTTDCCGGFDKSFFRKKYAPIPPTQSTAIMPSIHCHTGAFFLFSIGCVLLPEFYLYKHSGLLFYPLQHIYLKWA